MAAKSICGGECRRNGGISKYTIDGRTVFNDYYGVVDTTHIYDNAVLTAMGVCFHQASEIFGNQEIARKVAANLYEGDLLDATMSCCIQALYR